MNNRAPGRFWSCRRRLLTTSPKTPIVLPITSGGDFARTRGFAVSLDAAGAKTHGVIRCDQPRTIDMGARGGRKVESAPQNIIDEVMGRLLAIMG